MIKEEAMAMTTGEEDTIVTGVMTFMKEDNSDTPGTLSDAIARFKEKHTFASAVRSRKDNKIEIGHI